MSSGWRYGYDTVLMNRHIQSKTLYMCDQFGVNGKMYVGAIKNSCFMVKHTLPRTPGITEAKDINKFSS